MKFDIVMPETLLAALDAECSRTLVNRVHVVRQLLLARYPDHAGVRS